MSSCDQSSSSSISNPLTGTLGQMADRIHEQALASKEGFGTDLEEHDVVDDDGEIEQQGNESTGRWTKEEHELFLEALKRYGKEWKKVASMVKTRTVVQTRTHAQKYFQKLAKNTTMDEPASVERSVEKKSSIASSSTKRVRAIDQSPAGRFDHSSFQPPRIFSPDAQYYPLESEVLQPFEKVSTPSNTAYSQLFLLPPPPPSPFADFPQPSPAACGKRKVMELNAAEVLASGGSSRQIDLESAKLLTKMKEESIERSVNHGRRFRQSEMNLSIINPQGMLLVDCNEPGTPWEKQISALQKLDQQEHSSPISSLVSVEQHFAELSDLVQFGDFDGISNKLFQLKERRVSVSDVLNHTDSTENKTLLTKALLTSVDLNTIMNIVKLLLDNGAAPNSIDSNGNSPLHFAADLGYERVGESLLNKGAHINELNKDGNAAVHIAAMQGHIPFLQMLARLGANFHLRNGNSMSALDLAGTKSSNPGEREVLRKAMLFAEPRLRTLILYHQDFMEHSARRSSDWEGPDRLKSIMAKISNRQEFPDYTIEISSQFEKADVELLGRVHSPEYLTFVNTLSKQVRDATSSQQGLAIPFTPLVQKHILHQSGEDLKRDDFCDTSFSAGTLNAARRAAGAVAHAVDRVMLGRNRNAFCAIRPPGHHAGYRGLLDGAESCGFCIFNNVAAGALHALTEHQCERVAIIDFDIHHGNGTEDIVRRYEHPSRLFFFSVHLFDHDSIHKYKFYPGTGYVNDSVHNIINVPLSPLWKLPFVHSVETDTSESTQSDDSEKRSEVTSRNSGRCAFQQAISQRLVPSLRAFNPQLILLSSGFDGALGDVGNCLHRPDAAVCAGMNLTPEDFAWATTEILKIADICCSGRVVSVLEGGYGEYDASVPSNLHKRTYSTRSSAGGDGSLTSAQVEIDANSVESHMNRCLLSECAAAHVHRMIDPYSQVNFNASHF